MAGILSPIVGRTEHHVKNIQDFVSKVKDRKLEEGWTIVSYDVVSLFTCIPIEGAVSAVRELLEKDTELHTRTAMSVNQICRLVEMCLSCSYFLCDGKYYKQKHGCAMGSPLSPIVVNIYMERFEQLALRTYQGIPPALWVRYVDDTYLEIKTDELEPFFAHANSVDKHIQFTQDGMIDRKLAFLDAGVSVKDEGTFGITVYRKPTHTNQYLLFDSHHPLDHKLGVVRTLFHRANTVVTSPEDREAEHDYLKNALQKCGYSDWTFQKALKPKSLSQKESEPRTSASGKRVNVTLPYVAGTYEKVKRLLMKQGISVSTKPSNTLRDRLVHPKDKIPLECRSDVVYKVECGDPGCDRIYIGETQQTVKARMKQHAKLKTSSVFQHMQETGHKFDPLTTVSIVDKEPRWFERGVREAIYERVQQPAINKKGGLRFMLPHSWDRALASSLGHTSMNSKLTAITASSQETSAHNTEEGHLGMTRNICQQ